MTCRSYNTTGRQARPKLYSSPSNKFGHMRPLVFIRPKNIFVGMQAEHSKCNNNVVTRGEQNFAGSVGK